MKKLFLSFLAALIAVSIISCGTQPIYSSGNAQSGQIQSNHGGTSAAHSSNEGLTKISGIIEDGTTFSEGLAFVKLYKNESTVYCINQDGYIIFSIDDPLVTKSMINTGSRELEFEKSFANGLADIGECICDTKGNIIFPEDVGVTSIDGEDLLEYGYMLAEVIEGTYNTSSKKLGVLDTNFKWVVQPTEELYEKKSEFSFFKDGYIGFKNGYCIDVSTGTIVTSESIGADTSSKSGEYVNGMKIKIIYNKDIDQYFFTLADEEENFKFEPVAIDYNKHECRTAFDGELVAFSSPLQVYDINGNLLASENKTNLNTPKEFSEYEPHSLAKFEVNDGIVCYVGFKVYSNQSIWYFDKNLNLLFQ